MKKADILTVLCFIGVYMKINCQVLNTENSSQEDTSKIKRQTGLELEDDYYYDTVYEPIEEYLITPNDQLWDCGKQDRCPSDSNHEKLEKASGNFPGRDKIGHDFQLNPFKCHCDLTACSQYGDCCWEMAANFSSTKNQLSLRGSNPWKCHPLPTHERTVRHY